LIQELETLDFICDMSQATGVKVAIGVNAYIEEPDQISSYMVLIDPSSLSGEDESKLEEYSKRRNLRVVDEWNDWGRFLKIIKLRPVFASAISP
jgi:hypothetical protein